MVWLVFLVVLLAVLHGRERIEESEVAIMQEGMG